MRTISWMIASSSLSFIGVFWHSGSECCPLNAWWALQNSQVNLHRQCSSIVWFILIKMKHGSIKSSNNLVVVVIVVVVVVVVVVGVVVIAAVVVAVAVAVVVVVVLAAACTSSSSSSGCSGIVLAQLIVYQSACEKCCRHSPVPPLVSSRHDNLGHI